MRSVVLGPPSAESEALIARRRALGLDTHDEVWEGEYHVAPAAHPYHGYLCQEVASLLRPLGRAVGLVVTAEFNLGDPPDYRVPDGGFHRSLPTVVFVPTAAVVIEVASPHDESWEKLDFYARRSVDEVVIVAGETRTVTWMRLEDGEYVEADHSGLLGEESRDLAARIDWPPEDPPT